MYVIDVNTSFGKRVDSDPRYSPAALVEELEQHHVACALSYSQKGVEYDPRAGNIETLAVTAGERRILPVATVDPRDTPGWEVELKRCQKTSFRAIRLFPGTQGWPVDSACFRKILVALQELRLPLIISTMECPTGWELSYKIAELTTSLGFPVILTDTSYSNMAETIAVMQEFPHVYAETNWLASVDAITVMAREVGTERLLYGSAAPGHPMQKALNQILEADISDIQKQDILGSNSMRLFEIAESELSDLSELSSLEPVKFEEEIIDVHSHLGYWRFPVPDEDYDPSGMLKRMERYRISHSILSSYESMRYDIASGNRAIAKAIGGHPELLGYVELNPYQLELSCREMDCYYRMPNFVGCELELTHIFCPTASPKVRALIAEVAKRGKPVLFMPASSVDAEAERTLARENSKLTFIHAHAFDAEWAQVVKDTPNICVEFNRSQASHHDIRDCLDILGAGRVLFGSDQTLLSVGAAVGLYLDACMNAEERRLVLSENSRRVFRLG